MPSPSQYHPPFAYLPPPVQHKVWILDCKACGMFITNRAMKAVLLLRPNVSLYSSDALPINCSAHNTNPDALRPPSYHKPIPSRTCECLTQTLCCHGCGSSIGYMIVIPCSRCTSSITTTNRATNGHRFVFHSSEVSGSERYHIKNELGVIPFDPLPPQNMAYDEDLPFPRASSPAYHTEYLPTPPLEFASSAYAASRQQSPDAYDRIHSPSFHRRSPPPPFSGSPYQHRLRRPSDSPPPLSNPNFYPTDVKDPPVSPPSLKPGDTLFWHHLSRSGEISGVTDDTRARHSTTARAAGQVFFDR